MNQKFKTIGPTAAIVACAIIVRTQSWLSSDVSNLITLSEKYIDGAKPYVDFPEVNPPASILLYVPAVFLGRWFGITPEAALTALVFAAVATSVLLTAKIVEEASLVLRQERLVLLAATCAVLLVLPEDAFAQREHIALIAILPILAAYAARSSGEKVFGLAAIVAGVFGGVAVCIKPHFGFALLFPILYSVWVNRRWPRVCAAVIFSLENIAAALVVSLYAVVVICSFPEYLSNMLPVVTLIYAPARLPWTELLRTGFVVLMVQSLVAVAIVDRKIILRPFWFVLLLAALGFLAAAVIQGKGWPYHGYPSAALMLMVLSASAIERLPEIKPLKSSIRAPWIATALVLVLGLYGIASMLLWPPLWYPAYVEAVAHHSPAHPKIATICGGPELAYPLVRILNGTQVGGQLGLNMAVVRLQSYGGLRSEKQRLAQRYARDERLSLAHAINTGRPDVVIVASGLVTWASEQPELAATLRRFHPVQKLETAEIWLPN